ncbi:hydroxyneurosporene synthase [Rhizobium sp. RU20A]|uniref:carotenoid 1,2-hydratase n=1 Tax=Rhizobium sp. RU20A TaxID=1907412 RepID=UPI000954ED00|nr:carotenoid 1,2-hydratase [Rhizobium sp. RU20A]SIR42638.1 hydroxyneurosporene synthase [Rhizobium sp. RU20A]
MTERGAGALARSETEIAIGRSRMAVDAFGALSIHFDETALPWPGHRLLPRRITGSIRIEPEAPSGPCLRLDGGGHHHWQPRIPTGRASVSCDALPGGGWQGHGYHDWNAGTRPPEQDFSGWDWARGILPETGETVILYDARLADGSRRAFGLRYAPGGSAATPEVFTLPPPQALPRGFWGVTGSIACDPDARPVLRRRLEDTPFYTRALVDVVLGGRPVSLVQETLDCKRLANPLVRLMLPFRMPRRG